MRMPNLTQALRVRKVLYHLRGLPLPVPMTVPEFGMVLAGSAVALFMLTAHLIASPVELLIIAGLVGVLVYALRQESVDGKTPGQWLVTALRWMSSPGALIGAHPDLEQDLSVRVEGFVVPRDPAELRSWTPPLASVPTVDAGPSVMAPVAEPFAAPEWLPLPALPDGANDGGHHNGHSHLTGGGD